MLILAATKAKPLIDWAALGKVLVISLIFGVGVVAVLSGAIALYSDASDHRGARKAFGTLGAAVGLLAVLGSVVFAVIVMMEK